MCSGNNADDVGAFGAAEEVDTNPGGAGPSELLVICFGDLVPKLPCVLISLQVRLTDADGGVREGDRPLIMIDYSTLSQLRDNLPALLAHMKSEGSDVDRIEPPFSPIPAWNEGPRFTGPMDMRGICAGFGFFEDTLRDKGAAMAYIELRDAVRDEVTGGRYIVPHRVIVDLLEALPKVLRKMEQKGHAKRTSLH